MSNDEDEEATLLMPSPQSSAEELQSELCPTPAVGVASMGDTYFEATPSGAGSALPLASAQSGLVESPESKGDADELHRNALSTPITTTAPLKRGERLTRAPWWQVLERKKLLWPAALLAGAIVGLIVALALRGARSSAASGSAADPVAKGLQASEAASALDEPEEEASPSPGAPKTVGTATPPADTPGEPLLKADEVRVLQKEAVLAELGGDCQESMRLYAELQRVDQPATGERWQPFLRAVRHHCAHVELDTKRTGEGP